MTHSPRVSVLAAVFLLLLLLVATHSAHAQVNVACSFYESEYAAQFSIGTPAQSVYLILDSGSGNLAVTTPTTTTVIQHSPVYDPTQSSTAQPYPASSSNCASASTSNSNVCGTTVQYGTGGLSGELYSDVVAIGGLSTSSSFLFTVMTSENGGSSSTPFSAAGVAGILGLGYPVLSGGGGNTQVPDLIGTLTSANGLPNQFGMCLSSPNTGTGNGVFTIGGTAPSLYNANTLQWAYQASVLGLVSPATGYFTVNVVDFAIGMQTQEQLLGVSQSEANASWNQYGNGSPGTIVDSGTTSLVIPQALYNAVSSIVSNASGSPPPIYLTLSGADTSSTITLTIPGSIYANLLQGSGSEPGGILGQPLLQSYYTIFDRDNNRVGFAQMTNSDCPMPSANDAQTQPTGTNKGTNYGLAIGLPIGLVAGIALILAAVLLVRRRVLQRRQSVRMSAAQLNTTLLSDEGNNV